MCLVFGKVNTGGMPFSVFELVTSTWAADGFNLRDDWFSVKARAKKGGAATIQSASFNPNRLNTMRSRVSTAYRGLYVLIQREGAKDFFWKSIKEFLDE